MLGLYSMNLYEAAHELYDGARIKIMHSPRCATLRFSAVMILVSLLCACSKRQDREEGVYKELFPVGSPMADSISFQYAVYMLPVARKSPLLLLRHVLATKYRSLKLAGEIPTQPQEMVLYARTQKDVQKEYAPPSLKSLQYFGRGLSREQAQALQKSKEVFILDFAHPKGSVWTALRTANELVEEVARKTGGLVWDEEAREVFTPDAWHEKRLASWSSGTPDISSQTVIHVYNNGEYARAITLGMMKVGLPDVVIQEISWSSKSQVGDLINIFCQAMAEGATLEKPGTFKIDLRLIKNLEVRDSQLKTLKENATGAACLCLKQGKWEEGDPKNRLIQLTADKYSGPDLHARQDQMLGSFFGWEDSVHRVQHNEELLAASRTARARLPELQRTFAAGLEPGEFIQVKTPFPTPDGGREWMWVEVTNWKGNKIKGVLDNEPSEIPSLHSGQVVEVQQDEVFDYLRTYPDKHTEGNTTGDIIRRMEREESEGANSSQSPRPSQPAIACGTG
jgi:uncharacterized protein YegJ (DUF2314 family)